VNDVQFMEVLIFTTCLFWACTGACRGGYACTGACQSADPATSIRIYTKSTRIYKTSNYISVRYASNGAASPL